MKRVLTAVILPVAAMLAFASLADQALIRSGRGLAESIKAAKDARADMAQAQTDRRINRRAGEILAHSRGRLTLDQAQAVSLEMEARCDREVTPGMIMRLISKESSWTPTAIGRHGEIGLCQVRPSSVGIPAHELADPAVNVAAGIDHLRMLVERTGSVGLGLAAFNGGLYSGPVKYARAVMGGERP